ncbi:hypothetical protein ACYOEI_23585 [Singulisphaera rosea]
MILSDGQVLDSVRFNALVQDQYTRYQQSLPLRFLDRCEITPAEDDEITAYFTGSVYVADIISDDSEAATYEAGQLEYVTNVIPNLKIGRRFSQSMINRLNRIRRNMGDVKGDVTMFTNWQVRTAQELIRSIKERMNSLVCGMLLDSVTYDRLGIKITGSWGMPSDLKVTVSTAWADGSDVPNVNATPVTDILTFKQYAANTYGEVYDRLTLSQADFIAMVSTTEFKSLLAGLVTSPIATSGWNPRDARMPQFASTLLNMEIEFEDRLMFSQGTDGSRSNSRVFPKGKVLFSNKSDDKNAMAYDFGNAIVTESQVAGLVGDPDNVPQGEQFGPFSYFTGVPDLNPPQLKAWSVARGFPRKLRKTCTGVLTVR